VIAAFQIFFNSDLNNMEIIINSVKFKADTVLETFVREKVSKLFHQYDKIIRANVVLRKPENSKPEKKLCEIRLMIPGNDHFVRKCTGVYEKSILQAVEALQKIIRRKKNKEIRKRHSQ
jgi:ribosome-associated translation inhibitor RaiA